MKKKFADNIKMLKFILLALEEEPINETELIELVLQYGSRYNIGYEEIKYVLNMKLIDFIGE